MASLYDEHSVVRAGDNKFRAKSVGKSVVSIVGAGRVYTVVFIVENPTLNIQDPSFACVGKNKYSINTGVDETIETRFTYIDQQIVFKSNKPEVAYIDERGKLIIRKAGKAKLTTKINGKTVTLNVIAEE